VPQGISWPEAATSASCVLESDWDATIPSVLVENACFKQTVVNVIEAPRRKHDPQSSLMRVASFIEPMGDRLTQEIPYQEKDSAYQREHLEGVDQAELSVFFVINTCDGVSEKPTLSRTALRNQFVHTERRANDGPSNRKHS